MRAPLLSSFISCVLLLPVGLAAGAPPAPGQSEIYVIPFSHLDLYWGGTEEECLSRGSRIITRAIQLAEKYPEFRYLLEDEIFTATFADSMRGTPELEQLKRMVKEGRIEIAPKWAAIYQNLPRGEAQVRNLVYGKRYAREVFGVDPKVAHMGDLPGFTRQYPQILAKADTPYMVMTRMAPPDKTLFRWKAPDGSIVLVWHTIQGYGWGVDLRLHRDLDESRLARIAREVDAVQATTAGPVYLGWGTDLWAPNDKLVENMALLNQTLAPRHFRLATPGEYFRAAGDTRGIPELAGEIPSSWANVITSMSHLWPPVMRATDLLLSAEKFAAINDALGYAPYPEAEIESLWKQALESMDHNNYGQGGDIGDERKLGHARAVELEAGQILRDSLRNLAERVQHPFAKSTPIVVFNPLSWTRDDVVEAHVTLYGDVAPADLDDYKKGMRLVDEKGAAIPFRVKQYSENISRALELVFVARAVPSLGYKTYYLTPAEHPEEFPNACSLKLDADNDARQPLRIPGSDVVENEFYRVTVDRATGRIEIFDKELNRTVAKDVEIAAAEERGGNTLSIEPQTGRTIINVINRVELEENSAVRTVMRISGDVAGIPIVQRLSLYRGLKRINLENTVDWKPGRFLKIEQVFPLQQTVSEVRNGVPFGSAAEADLMENSGPRFPDEVPRETWKGWRQIQDWVFAGASEWGVTIAADHQLLNVTGQAIRAGMVRGTRFNPLHTVRDGKTILVQQPAAGAFVFRYSFTSGPGNWAAAKSWRAGMAFNTPLLPVSAVNDLSRKPLPAEQSFLLVDADNLVVSALKKADHHPGIILRLFEIRGEAARSSVRFLGQDRSIRSLNLLEQDLGGGERKVLPVGPYEITTVSLKLP